MEQSLIIRQRCSVLIGTDPKSICEIMFRFILEEEENIWKMFLELIRDYIWKRDHKETFWDVFRKIIDDVSELSIYLSLVMRTDTEGRWWIYIWPFGDKRIYLPLRNDTENHVYILQCIQILISCGEFTIKERNIYGFEIKYTSFNYNLRGNKFIDKNRILKCILSKTIEIYNKFIPLALYYDHINTDVVGSMKMAIHSSLKIPPEDKLELINHIDNTEHIPMQS